MQALQSNIIHAVGRLSINWNTPNLKSVPFTQLQYHPPDEAHVIAICTGASNRVEYK